MKRILVISDTFDFKPSSRVYLDNGFLRVTGKAARTGVYQYLASELGLNDRSPNAIVNVYRPENEVFKDESIQSYFNVDVTNDHPSQMVDASSFKGTSVGHVVSAVRNGDFIDIEMIVKDESAIKDIEKGKNQLSPGYTAVYVEEKGVSPDGQTYDFKQTEIDVNHVAIVSRGRGGVQVRINDNDRSTAMIKITLDSGRTIEIEDNAQGALISDSMTRLQQSVTDAKNEVETQKAVIDAQAIEIKDLKASTSDEALTERVKAVTSTIDAARKKVGKDFTSDSVDPVEIQREALQLVNKDADYTGKHDEYINGLFDAMPDKKEDGEDDETNDAGGRGKQRYSSTDHYSGLTNDGSRMNDNEPPKKSAYDAYCDRLTGKGKQ